MTTEKETIEVPKKFKEIVEQIEQMSAIDLSELVKILEEKFGVSSAAPMMMGPMPGSVSAVAPAEEEKSVFNIELKQVGEKKIEVIKLVRDLTGKGLKEAKDLVDAAAAAPQVLKENVKKEEADEIKKKMTEAGATVELK